MDELEKIRKKKTEELIKKYKDSKMETEIEVNDGNFEKEVLEKLAKEYGSKFVLTKANIDNARTKTQEYGIMSIPTVNKSME